MDVPPPPPAIYDHAPRGKFAERRGSLAQVEYFCHTLQGVVSAYRAYGCAKIVDNKCLIMIPKVGGPISAHLQFQIRRHEIAHCNGWAGHHPR